MNLQEKKLLQVRKIIKTRKSKIISGTYDYKQNLFEPDLIFFIESFQI